MKTGTLYTCSQKLPCCLTQNRYSLQCVDSGWFDCTSILHTSAKIWKPDQMHQADLKHTYDVLPWRKIKIGQMYAYNEVLLHYRMFGSEQVFWTYSRITMCSNSHLPPPHFTWLGPIGFLTHTLSPVDLAPQENTSNQRRCLSFLSYL